MLAYLSLRGYCVCVLCWDSLNVIHCWYYHMLIKIITHIYPDLPVCQYVCCTDPPKKLLTFMNVDLFIKQDSVYKPYIVYTLNLLFSIFCVDV